MTEYFKLENAPGEYFRCRPYDAVMSVAACAELYGAEKGNRAGLHPHCLGCPVGAKHAGDEVASSVFGSKLCPRCHKAGTRIVRGVCVSCLNRQYEVEKGKNAKGKVPVTAPHLHACLLSVSSHNSVSRVCFDQAAGMIEAIYRVLRSDPGNPLFAWRRNKPRTAQRSFFD